MTGIGLLIEIAILLAVLTPQSFLAVTVMLPEPDDPADTVNEGVEVVKGDALNPLGIVQIYSVAPVTAGTEYVADVPGHTSAGPAVNAAG